MQTDAFSSDQRPEPIAHREAGDIGAHGGCPADPSRADRAADRQGRPRSIRLIVKGGETDNIEAAEQAAARHAALGRRIEVLVTAGAGDARTLARRAVEDGIDRIIVMGGDGTINEVVNGIAPDFGRTELAVVPAGTANDFARTIGMPADNQVDAIEQAIARDAVPVDVIRATADDGTISWFINVAAGGYGGEVSEEAARRGKGDLGAAAYWVAGASKLVDLPSYQATLIIDRHRIEAPIFGLAIANARYVAGGIPIAPDAMLDDGVMDVVVVAEQSFADVLGAGADILLRRQGESDRVTALRGRCVRVRANPGLPFNEDGEVMGPLSGLFEVEHRALAVVLGAEAERCVESLSLPSSASEASAADEPGLKPVAGVARATELDEDAKEDTQTIAIPAPLAEVLAALVDPTGWPAWHPNIDRVDAIEEAPPSPQPSPSHSHSHSTSTAPATGGEAGGAASGTVPGSSPADDGPSSSRRPGTHWIVHEKSGEVLHARRTADGEPIASCHDDGRCGRRVAWRFDDVHGTFQREWQLDLDSCDDKAVGGDAEDAVRPLTRVFARQRQQEESGFVRLIMSAVIGRDSELRLFLGALSGHFGAPLTSPRRGTPDDDAD